MPENNDPHRSLGTTQRFLGSSLGAPLVLLSAVFLACLFGIYTRPIGFLATVWPANAIMLGLLIRLPRSAGALGWLGAAAAYMAADLLTGSTVLKALILNAANVVGVAAAFLIYTRLPSDTARLQQPASMLYLVVASAAAGAAAGVIGGIANPILFDRGAISGWTFWFATEFVNYIAILPVILSAPSLFTFAGQRTRPLALPRPTDLLPAVVLAFSCLAAVVIGGPGAIAFPVPALLWCGLVYPVFPTSVLTLLFGVWTLVVISAGYVPNPAAPYDEMALVSVRLGVSLIALAPIMLASVMQSRNDLLVRLHHLAMHDPLTGANNRNAFREGAQRLLTGSARSLAVLMIDLDHFKAVNDKFGHTGGDEVLISFVRRAKSCLRSDDLLGRLGGEEFAVLLPDCLEPEAITIADRIRTAVSGPLVLSDGRSLTVTASIGMVIAINGNLTSVDHLLADADALLYCAKERGRDRVEMLVKYPSPLPSAKQLPL